MLRILSICVILLTGCGKDPKIPGEDVVQDQQELTGAELYAIHCADCHNDLRDSTKMSRSATDIRRAIDRIGVMNKLSILDDTTLEKIAGALQP